MEMTCNKFRKLTGGSDSHKGRNINPLPILLVRTVAGNRKVCNVISVLSRTGRNICGQVTHQKALGEVATDICLNRCGTQIRIVLFLSVLIIGAGFKAASGQHWCALDEFCTQIVTDKLLRSANRDKRSLLILSTVYRNTKPNVCVVANSEFFCISSKTADDGENVNVSHDFVSFQKTVNK